jgi:sulfite exporter TauE/SafE
MMPDVSGGAWQALLAGLIVSPHCVAMCGPLACSFLISGSQAGAGSEYRQSAYHVGRVCAYTALGFLAGALSLPLVRVFEWDLSRFLPWLLVLLMLAFALGMDRWMPKSTWLALWHGRLQRKMQGRSGLFAAFSIGAFSPLLPCAPLYSVLWVALVSASPAFGAQVMLGFSLGTIPLLWLLQSQWNRRFRFWTPGRLRLFQRMLAAVAALVIAARLIWLGAPLSGNTCWMP